MATYPFPTIRSKNTWTGILPPSSCSSRRRISTWMTLRTPPLARLARSTTGKVFNTHLIQAHELLQSPAWCISIEVGPGLVTRRDTHECGQLFLSYLPHKLSDKECREHVHTEGCALELRRDNTNKRHNFVERSSCLCWKICKRNLGGIFDASLLQQLLLILLDELPRLADLEDGRGGDKFRHGILSDYSWMRNQRCMARAQRFCRTCPDVPYLSHHARGSHWRIGSRWFEGAQYSNLR